MGSSDEGALEIRVKTIFSLAKGVLSDVLDFFDSDGDEIFLVLIAKSDTEGFFDYEVRRGNDLRSVIVHKWIKEIIQEAEKH